MGTTADVNVSDLRRQDLARTSPLLELAFWYPRSLGACSILLLSSAGFSLALALVGRGSFLAIDTSLNVDEAEFLAQGSLANADIAPSRTFSTSTFGPIVPMLMGTVQRLGVEPSFSFAHLVSAITVAVIAWSLFLALIAARCPPLIAGLAVVPALVSLSIAGLPGVSALDFASLSSSALAVLCLAIALPLGIWGQRNVLLLAMTMVLCGFAPWIKFQALPLALLLAAALLANAGLLTPKLGLSNLQVPSLLLLAFLLPSIVLAAWMLQIGTLDDFCIDSLTSGTSYVQRGGLNANTSLIERSSTTLRLIAQQPLLVSPLVIPMLLIPYGRGPRKHLQIYSLALIVVGYLCVALPGTNSGHYLYFWLIAVSGAGTMFILSLNGLRFPKIESQLFRLGLPLLLNLVVLTTLLGSIGAGGALPADRGDASKGALISAVCPRDSRVMIWGWAPELYAYFGWYPAIRYPFLSTSIHTLESQRAEKEFAEVQNGLRQGSVDCIVNALHPPFFTISGAHRQDISQIVPGIESSLTEYNRITIDGTPLSIRYRRNGGPYDDCLNLPDAAGVQCVVGAA